MREAAPGASSAVDASTAASIATLTNRMICSPLPEPSRVSQRAATRLTMRAACQTRFLTQTAEMLGIFPMSA
jgi:hypothetical protein